MATFVSKFVNAWLHPWATMAGVKAEGENASIKPSMTFVVLMGFLAGIITTLVALVEPAPVVNGQVISKGFMALSIVIVPVASFIGSFVGAGILWALIYGLLKGNASQYKMTYRLMAVLSAYSPISAALASIPKVGQWVAVAINVWALFVLINGIITVMETPKVRTWVACVLVFGLLLLLGVAARYQTANSLSPAPNFDDFNDTFSNAGPDNSLPSDDEDLTKKLDELSNQAKSNPAPAAVDNKKK